MRETVQIYCTHDITVQMSLQLILSFSTIFARWQWCMIRKMFMGKDKHHQMSDFRKQDISILTCKDDNNNNNNDNDSDSSNDKDKDNDNNNRR